MMQFVVIQQWNTLGANLGRPRMVFGPFTSSAAAEHYRHLRTLNDPRAEWHYAVHQLLSDSNVRLLHAATEGKEQA